MVVIIEGNKEEKEAISYSQLIGKVDSYLKEGLSTKEAIKKVAKEHNVSKNELYKEFHGLN